jgi:hypothetical protein
MKIPAKVMPRFAGLKEKISGDADNADLRKAILEALPEAVEQTKELAPYFKATNERETAKRIFDFLKKRVKYKADDYRQVIQLPSAILRPGAIADCKSLSLFTAAILQNLGIPWHFVLASYSDSTIPGHIYVQTDSGVIIDVVWGKFDSEKKPKYRYVMRNTYTTPEVKSAPVGLGATESAAEWAIRNGIWYSFNNAERLAINAKKVMPLAAIARGVVLTAIAANGGGIASMLKTLSIEATGSPGTNPRFKQSSFDKFRTIEIAWLKQGGNPNELYDAINKGESKQPRGKVFGSLLEKAAKGQSVRPDQWLTGIFSAIFGKKYTPGISGEPVSTTATTVASSSVWIPILQNMATTIGAALVTSIVSKIAPAPGEGANQTAALPAPSGDLQPAASRINPLIIGGVVIAGLAAVYFATKNKK